MVTKTYGLATRMTADSSRCEALFASALQRSDAPTADVVAETIARTVRQFGTRGCACRMAQEFGEHPEAAAERMRWVRQLITQTAAPR
jgi:ferredoxin-thioredoxin reductase catalytic subunit